MKRHALYLLASVLVFAAAPAYAATVSLSPAVVSVTAGQSLSIQVSVDAAGDRVVSAQTQLSYPADLLQPVSFTFAPNWTQTFDVGTNVMASGTVIQAGAYAASFYGVQPMGTLTFTALKSGVATVAVSNSNTYIFETDGGNLFTGPPSSAQVDIAPGAPGAGTETPVVQNAPILAATTTPTNVSLPAPQSTIAIAAAAVLVLVIVTWAYIRARGKRRKRRR